MPEPAVAIVIPTRNRAKLLRETLDAVGAQAFTDWECLVIDDGSVDGTAEDVVRRAAQDPRFRFFVRHDGAPGANACRNLGIRQSQADLIMLLDSDDLLAPMCLSTRVAMMRRNPDADFVVFDGDVFRERIGDLHRRFDMGCAGADLDRFLALDPPWDVTGPIWRKSLLNTLGGFDEHLTSWQDIDLHIRALAAAPRYFRERVVDHHIRWKANEDRTSHKKAFSTDMFENCEACVGKWRRALEAGRSATPARDEAIAGIAFHLAEQWALQGHPSRGQRVWRVATDFGIAGGHLVAGRLFLIAMAAPLASTTAFRGLLRRWKVSARLMPPTRNQDSR